MNMTLKDLHNNIYENLSPEFKQIASSYRETTDNNIINSRYLVCMFEKEGIQINLSQDGKSFYIKEEHRDYIFRSRLSEDSISSDILVYTSSESSFSPKNHAAIYKTATDEEKERSNSKEMQIAFDLVNNSEKKLSNKEIVEIVSLIPNIKLAPKVIEKLVDHLNIYKEMSTGLQNIVTNKPKL